jgi:hypothetical protein
MLNWADTPRGRLGAMLGMRDMPDRAALVAAEERVDKVRADLKVTYGRDLTAGEAAAIRFAETRVAPPSRPVPDTTAGWQELFEAQQRLVNGVAWQGPDGADGGSAEVAARGRAAMDEHDAMLRGQDLEWANGPAIMRTIARPR